MTQALEVEDVSFWETLFSILGDTADKIFKIPQTLGDAIVLFSFCMAFVITFSYFLRWAKTLIRKM